MLPADIVPFKCTTLAVITDSVGQLVPIIEVALKKHVVVHASRDVSSDIPEVFE